MAVLSTSNLLWYIYQRNCEVGYPTVITMGDFLHEFSPCTRNDIERELDNVIKEMGFVRKRFFCVYDLTENGLDEVMHLKKFVPHYCKVQKGFVFLIQKVVCVFFKPNALHIKGNECHE